MFQDKLFLVVLVLGLLTIVAAAGVVTIQRGKTPGEENPYMQKEQGAIIAEESPSEKAARIAGNEELYSEAPESHINNRAETEPVKMAKETESPKKEAEPAKGSSEPKAAQAGSGVENALPLVLNFSEAGRLEWPVLGNVLLDYSMDTTIYFPTLDQYQVNPGVVIQAEVSQPVVAPANAKVVAVSSDEELGNFLVLDLGNDYVATCGQLKEIQVVENEYLEAGQVMGYVAEPTKYYSVEGSNVYFQLEHGGQKVDPVDYFE